MHILNIDNRSIDGAAPAVDLGQTPADLIVLSFADADLSMVAAAWEATPGLPSLRLANLAALRHPYSIDLYLEKVIAHAKFVVVRLLGGKDYWRYGVDELSALARARGIHLAIVPGDQREDARLDQNSTLDLPSLRRIWSYFSTGGLENITACLRLMASWGGDQPILLPARPVENCGLFAPADRTAPDGAPDGAPVALILLYRAWMLSADTKPVIALANALAARGFRVVAWFVTSLKDPAVITPTQSLLAAIKPAVILNLTSFSARIDAGGSLLDAAGAPVLQLALSGGAQEQWAASQRGLGPADLAMNIVLPELDGRILTGAISFKGAAPSHEALEFTRLTHVPHPDGIAHAADLATAWTRLRRTARKDRHLACVLSDYPAKRGRAGYAMGLDTPQSVIHIAAQLRTAGYQIEPMGDSADLMAGLTIGMPEAVLSLDAYRNLRAHLPPEFVAGIDACWGEAALDASVIAGAFHFRFVRAGNFIVAVQPDRGHAATRKDEYHSANLPPRHGFVAFYLWLRHVERIHALIHCGTHGTLEWLPGKAVALSPACAPQAVLGATPLIYPFIVNNPGEAAQAKRRSAAVTIGHLTPPLVAAPSHGAAAELEALFDEYAEAQAADPSRASRLAALIVARAHETGLAAESGVAPDAPLTTALVRLDSWLCDLKELRIGDGLHVFGATPDAARAAPLIDALTNVTGGDAGAIAASVNACGKAEMDGLLAALDGRFVPPGPAGAPSRGRVDVLPTGRNLFSVDPRAIPTRTAWEIGSRTAAEILTLHVQEHGDWPRSMVLDLWGSASMRTGGDDLAQGLALLGVRPVWDGGSNRVSGFDILPLALLARPRVDVTLRISGLFRDVFASQIALFDQAVQAVAALDESAYDNPLAASRRAGDQGFRIFGAAPGDYGVGLSAPLASGDWTDRAALGEAYLAASSHAYGARDAITAAATDFRTRVATADVFVHVQDNADQDLLSGDAFAQHEGGFAAAAATLGNNPALYHADTSDAGRSRVRTLRAELARVLRGRAINPLWLAGQMRHGFRGAAEIAETIDHFHAFAALARVSENYQFDLLFDATLGDEQVREFLITANPGAARGIAERFNEAAMRGLWTTRRNDVGAVLADLLKDPAP